MEESSGHLSDMGLPREDAELTAGLSFVLRVYYRQHIQLFEAIDICLVTKSKDTDDIF